MRKPTISQYRNAVRWIVDQLHVGTPDEEVMNAVLRRLAPGRWDSMSATERGKLRTAVLGVHHDNQGMYHYVMTGYRTRRRSVTL